MPGPEVDILLVEDNAADVELTLRALRSMKLPNRIHVVRDGAAALAFLRDASSLPKVILLDVKLPKVDGLEVLAQVKRDTRLRPIPVVMLTASRQGPDIDRAYQAGANSYLVKPVEGDAFVRAVSDAGLYWLLLNQAPRETVEEV